MKLTLEQKIEQEQEYLGKFRNEPCGFKTIKGTSFKRNTFITKGIRSRTREFKFNPEFRSWGEYLDRKIGFDQMRSLQEQGK